MQNWYGNYPMNMMFDKNEDDAIRFGEEFTENVHEYVNHYYDTILQEWKKYGATEDDVNNALEILDDTIIDIAYNSLYYDEYNLYECIDYLLTEDTIKQYLEEKDDE